MGFDSFKKQQSGRNKLVYDDRAFYFFLVTLLVIFWVIIIWNVLRTCLCWRRRLHHGSHIFKEEKSKLTFAKDNERSKYINCNFYVKVFPSPNISQLR